VKVRGRQFFFFSFVVVEDFMKLFLCRCRAAAADDIVQGRPGTKDALLRWSPGYGRGVVPGRQAPCRHRHMASSSSSSSSLAMRPWRRVVVVTPGDPAPALRGWPVAGMRSRQVGGGGNGGAGAVAQRKVLRVGLGKNVGPLRRMLIKVERKVRVLVSACGWLLSASADVLGGRRCWTSCLSSTGKEKQWGKDGERGNGAGDT
jgi:hypothetical protein